MGQRITRAWQWNVTNRVWKLMRVTTSQPCPPEMAPYLERVSHLPQRQWTLPTYLTRRLRVKNRRIRNPAYRICCSGSIGRYWWMRIIRQSVTRRIQRCKVGTTCLKETSLCRKIWWSPKQLSGRIEMGKICSRILLLLVVFIGS